MRKNVIKCAFIFLAFMPLAAFCMEKGKANSDYWDYIAVGMVGMLGYCSTALPMISALKIVNHWLDQNEFNKKWMSIGFGSLVGCPLSARMIKKLAQRPSMREERSCLNTSGIDSHLDLDKAFNQWSFYGKIVGFKYFGLNIVLHALRDKYQM